MRVAQLVTTAMACALPALVGAQLVTPKTIPVLQADQFDIFPASRWGMGGARITLDDTLADPFANPAKATRLLGSGLFVLPSSHAVSDGRGGGRSIPLGGYWTSGPWSGAAMAALQQLDRAGFGCCRTLDSRNANNEYVMGVLARRIGSAALGASVYYAGLGAIDGVDLLYAGSDTIQQDGRLIDVRLGLTKNWEDGRAFELLVLHNRTDMSHDVHFSLWTPGTPNQPGRLTTRWDHNPDQTNIWGLHSEYARPVGTEGWRLGWLATVNRLSHPKIPNYVLQNIPRDPGTTWAYNAGVGVGRTVGHTSFGLDLILEPMSAHTWADMLTDTVGPGGRVIPAGERTVENRFRFANRVLALGFANEPALKGDSTGSFGFQVGLSLRSINYTLRQTNHVAGTFRRQDEGWMEWSPTAGLRYRTRELEFQYGIRLTCATSGCSPSWGGGDDVQTAPPAVSGGVIAAPASALTFESGRGFAHRLTVVMPIR